MPDDALVGSDEASRIIGVPRSTFLRWVHRGQVRVFDKTTGKRRYIDVNAAHVMPGISGAYLFRRADIEQLASEVQAVADERVS
jgi:predicted site-specific integrase-resolvase